MAGVADREAPHLAPPAAVREGLAPPLAPRAAVWEGLAPPLAPLAAEWKGQGLAPHLHFANSLAQLRLYSGSQ